MKETTENENQEMEQDFVLWGEREKKEKISVLIGLSRSPNFKPISDMEVGEYEYWLRTNEDLFETIPRLALELSNFLNRKKFGPEEITYLDFQQFGFKVEHYDKDWCKFMKRTNDGEISGKFYFKDMQAKLEESALKHIHLREFIREMDLAYAAADVIVSRAGALSVSELSLVGKPVIFIPSPNVAEDHQTKNAMAYVSHQAAVLLKDADAVGQLKNKVAELLQDPALAARLGENIKKLAKPDAAKAIVKELEFLVK
jgi:UDP-N-acetylglucosamine transferase subunit ALG13